MVELVAIAFASASRWLWARAILGRVMCVMLWGGYGVGLPQGVHWSEENLPETVNLLLPLAGLLAATFQGLRHWYHHHRGHGDHGKPIQKHPAQRTV